MIACSGHAWEFWAVWISAMFAWSLCFSTNRR